ncbi:MlaD family protein [Zeaxanthinibacter enoshimensis]|uniref:Phospholipid/cholesterol/gamma-HCH transport system substrate-binding protein n=1 Tax=Zeaxanthinibacter enoshimensis TaxID=392009 RepID=A0A4R6TJL5_9FLAO|nr:MlaD family protein [Zeaxanthinibacter enoshimensis]TDQ31064.1 phospholipid/cholesterol/gamma-HCH transport system substrate-binding protein [Zeaxanthinibacter enoshimensis]
MEKTTTEKLRLGVFVLLGTILIVLAAYLIGNQKHIFGNTFTLHTTFKNVNGLQRGNNVRYAGINIGTVQDIEMVNDTSISVAMLIQDKMLPHIKKNATATIGSDGLVGSMIINIVPGEGEAPFVSPEDVISSYSRVATADMLNTLSVTNENAAVLLEDLLKVSASLNSGKGVLGRLLNDGAMADDLQSTLGNLRVASKEAEGLMQELGDVVGQYNAEQSVAGALFSDSIAGAKLRLTIGQLEISSRELQSVSVRLNEFIQEIQEGQGAINYLSTDTTMVGHLQRTMENVDQGMYRFNQNMEALQHNFLTRGYFRKIERQKKKEEKRSRE